MLKCKDGFEKEAWFFKLYYNTLENIVFVKQLADTMMTNVKIYKPAKNAMQSGVAKTGEWFLEYEVSSRREPDALMGWQSSEDTLNQVRLKFDTLEAAIARAEKEGWVYSVASEHVKKIKPRNYGDNFRYIPPEDDA